MKQVKLGVFCLWMGVFLSTSWASDRWVGQPARDFSGKPAGGIGLLSLNALMREISFLKDDQGQSIEKDVRYVMQVKKNVVEALLQ